MTNLRKLSAIVSLLFLVAAVGCKKEETSKVCPLDSFEEYVVEGDTVVPESHELMSAMFSAAGNYFVVQNAYGNRLFSVLNKQLELVDTIVQEGQGPQEMSAAMYVGQWQGNPENPSILVTESSKQRLVSLNINPFDSITPILRFPASEKFRPRFAYMRNDSLCVGLNIGVGQAAEIGCFNLNTKEVSYYQLPFEFDKTNAFYTSQGSLAINPTSGKSAIAFYAFPGIVVYNDDFTVEKILYAADSEINTLQLSPQERGAGFSRIMFCGDKLLALYTAGSQGENKILVFDKSCKPAASIPVGKSLWFDIDEASGNIVTTVFSEALDAVVFVVYPLPESLKI